MTNIEALDGRNARRIGNRRRMLAVGLGLMKRSNTFRVAPKDVTDGAELHPRSFHAIFGDLDGFYEELVKEHEASLREMITRHVKDKGASLPRLVLLGK